MHSDWLPYIVRDENVLQFSHTDWQLQKFSSEIIGVGHVTANVFQQNIVEFHSCQTFPPQKVCSIQYFSMQLQMILLGII